MKIDFITGIKEQVIRIADLTTLINNTIGFHGDFKYINEKKNGVNRKLVGVKN